MDTSEARWIAPIELLIFLIIFSKQILHNLSRNGTQDLYVTNKKW